MPFLMKLSIKWKWGLTIWACIIIHGNHWEYLVLFCISKQQYNKNTGFTENVLRTNYFQLTRLLCFYKTSIITQYCKLKKIIKTRLHLANLSNIISGIWYTAKPFLFGTFFIQYCWNMGCHIRPPLWIGSPPLIDKLPGIDLGPISQTVYDTILFE